MRLTAAFVRNHQRQSCKFVRNIVLLQKWNACLFTAKLRDAGIDDEAIDFQQLHVVAVGHGPTKLETEHHVASGHAQHRAWCDTFMIARGIAGRHERREPGREDEDPLGAIDCGYLKLDGTEDDDDETTLNKLLILVAKGVKTATYAATCLREREE